jgi:flagellin-like protein
LRRFLREHRAQVGIGTLIVFIAMILVAAVAAGVLLRTSGSLQQKATVTGEQSIKEVSTILKVQSVVGYTDDTSSNNLTALLLTVQLAAGSGDVRFEDILMTYQSGDYYVTGISFNSTHYPPASVDALNNGVADFGVRTLKENGNSILETGEMIEMVYWIEDETGTDMPLSADQTFIATLYPKGGQVTTIKKTAPAVISTRYISEWG